MKLIPREVDKLALHNAGYLAQKRLARGLTLNYTETVALIATQILEFVRDGDKTVAELMDIGKQLLGRRQVLAAVPHLLDFVQVEGTFPDGTKLITVHEPIACENGNMELALHGSFLPVPSLDMFPELEDNEIPGGITYTCGDITLNSGIKAVILKVVSIGDRPIQVGSHYHFIEVNPSLVFDRMKAYGMRLNIPAGTAVRFEPGDCKSVVLVSIGGKKVIRGGNGIVDGPVDCNNSTAVLEAVNSRGFGNREEENASEGVAGDDSAFTTKMSREAYGNMYGPTTGDKIRLGDTNLYAEIERDFAVYGDECVFGGGKVIRDGMGQSSGNRPDASLDTIITNAVVIDYTGVYKADIGIKGGLIIAIGKGGNPDIMNQVHVDMTIGVNTEVIAGEGMILTAGAIDCHVHFICPQLIHEKVMELLSLLKFEEGKTSKEDMDEISKSARRYASRNHLNIAKVSRVVNDKAARLLESMVRNHMEPVECAPFHEIVCFKSINKLKGALIGDPRRRVQIDLLQFQDIIQCGCCRTCNSLSPSMHDSSIMYSLAQEHGDLINLHDWYQSFKSVSLCSSNKGKHRSKYSPSPKKRKVVAGTAKPSEASIQARFCRAVTELKIVGLLQMPSKRRPDFVQRLAFGT